MGEGEVRRVEVGGRTDGASPRLQEEDGEVVAGAVGGPVEADVGRHTEVHSAAGWGLVGRPRTPVGRWRPGPNSTRGNFGITDSTTTVSGKRSGPPPDPRTRELPRRDVTGSTTGVEDRNRTSVPLQVDLTDPSYVLF